MAVDAYHEELAQRIKKLAARRKLSRNKLADFAGVSRGQLTAVLAAQQSPTVRTLKRIADALEVSARELLPP